MLGVEELYHRYRDDVFRYLCSLTHDPAWAEDLLSETFLQAIQSIDRFEARSGEKTWLFGIARHLWLQDLRRQRPSRAEPARTPSRRAWVQWSSGFWLL